jgi:hypothetical protein
MCADVCALGSAAIVGYTTQRHVPHRFVTTSQCEAGRVAAEELGCAGDAMGRNAVLK